MTDAPEAQETADEVARAVERVNLGQFLRECREALGLTLRQVEEITDRKVANATLSQVETGKLAQPSAYIVSILATAYGLDHGDVLRMAGDSVCEMSLKRLNRRLSAAKQSEDRASKRTYVLRRWSLRERLDSKAEWDPNTGCHLWFGTQGTDGYPMAGWKGRMVRVTRLSLMEATGVDGKGLLALHKCDTPLCINPAHLRWGSSADNVADMIRRRRGRPAQVYRKIGPVEEAAILAMHDVGVPARDIAGDFGRSRTTIACLIKRRQVGQGKG